MQHTFDFEVLSTVKGLPIIFEQAPTELLNQSSFEQRFSDTETEIIEKEISKLLKKGVIMETTHEEGEIISPIFLIPKPDGTMRFILNLKKLNGCMSYIHFKMDTINTVLSLVTPNCYMAKIDIKDAYYTVPILEGHQKYLKFKFQGRLFKFVALPNGLCSGPRKFTKLLKPPLAVLRKLGIIVAAYIDDLFTTDNTFNECYLNVQTCVKLLDSLGFVIHPDKSQFLPSQEIEYLGFVINSKKMIIYLNKEKREKIKALCEEVLATRTPSIRVVSKLLGKFTSSFSAVKYGRLFYRGLECCKIEALKCNKGKFDKPMKLNQEAFNDIVWWKDNIRQSYNQISRENPSGNLTTDASSFGWGAVYKGNKTGGLFSNEEKQLHINIKELKAIMFGLKTFCSELYDTHLKISTDNSTAVFTINNMGSCKSCECNAIVKEIWLWAKDKNIWLTATHIPEVLNAEVDKESRANEVHIEWRLDRTIFLRILETFDFQPEMDLFASRINTQVQKFVSYRPDPEACFINAFSLNWENILWYAFPPFSCIARVIQKIIFDGASGILIVPDWPYQPWYSLLKKILIKEPLIIPPSINQLYLPNQPEVIHPLHKQLQLLACLVSGKCLKHKDYQKEPFN